MNKIKVSAFNYTVDYPDVPDVWYWEWSCPVCTVWQTAPSSQGVFGDVALHLAAHKNGTLR